MKDIDGEKSQIQADNGFRIAKVILIFLSCHWLSFSVGIFIVVVTNMSLVKFPYWPQSFLPYRICIIVIG